MVLPEKLTKTHASLSSFPCSCASFAHHVAISNDLSKALTFPFKTTSPNYTSPPSENSQITWGQYYMFPPQTMHFYVANYSKLPYISIGFMIPPQIHSTFHDLSFKRRGRSAQNAWLKEINSKIGGFLWKLRTWNMFKLPNKNPP